MVTILFHSTIFGPIHSRRLGTSLGVNLSPIDGKVCSFDCIYCEAGYNSQGAGKAGLPSREEVARLLEEKLKSMVANGENLDVITFSGNGEPTIHPQFPEIIDDTIALRNQYFPNVKISVLCNSTRLGDESVVKALFKVVIDDTEYEIASRSDYLEYLETDIKRMKKAYGYFTKMMACKPGTEKHEYYKAGVRMFLYSNEDPYKVDQMIEEFKATYKNREETIQKLYLEVKEIKKLSVNP